MARSRASAKKAGTQLERQVADTLALHHSEFIDRRPKTGALDKGDIANVRDALGRRVVVEVKNTARTDLAGWAAEAEAERVNDAAAAGVVVSKRHGVGDPLDQWVHMTMRDLIVLLGSERPE